MFSRSDKTDEQTDDGPLEGAPKQRNPAVLAAFAGLLAVAGAFLLVRYLNTDNGSGTAAAEAQETRLVLIVTRPIPQGTEVNDIIASPTTYLASRDVPVDYIAPSAIGTVPDLRDYENQLLAHDVGVGEQLQASDLVDPNDFDSASFIEREAAVAAPPGHHSMVISVPSQQALGGNVRPGDTVAVLATFRVQFPEQEPLNIAMVVLPTVEVTNVETSAEVIGELAAGVSDLGTATVGDFAVTVAVKPDEVTDLLYAMEWATSLVLADDLEDSDELDERPFSTIETLISGYDFYADSSGLDYILENLIDPEELPGVIGLDPNEEGGAVLGVPDPEEDDGGDAPLPDAPEASPASADGASVEGSPAAQVDPPPQAPAVPPASTSDEPEPAGPGETVDQQLPVDDSNGDGGALPPGN